MDQDCPALSNRLHGVTNNVWAMLDDVMTQSPALDLGKGFPDSFPPDHVRESLIEAANATSPLVYQYTRNTGQPRLIKALAELFSPTFGRQIDPFNEVVITLGASGAIISASLGLLNPGDEIIIIEPFYDCFEYMVKLAGAVPVFVPLRPTKANATSSEDFKLDPDEFESKFTSKTKAVLFNTPNNPLGKVYSLEETEFIAKMCKKHDVIVFADEVYEFMVHPPYKHIKIATLGDMWERTLTIGSAGKLLNATGLRTGWAIGPSHLVKPCQLVLTGAISSCPTPIQDALGRILEIENATWDTPESFIQGQVALLKPKRDFIVEKLRNCGLETVEPQGGYFTMVNFENFSKKSCEDLCRPMTGETKDLTFAKWMIKEKGIIVLPMTAFYSKEHKDLGENYIRLCFCKQDSTLQKAVDILSH